MIEPLAPELKSLFDEERSSHPDRSELRKRVLSKLEASIALGAGVVVVGAAAQGTATGTTAAMSPLASIGIVKVAMISFVVGGLFGGSTVAIVDRTFAKESRVEVPADHGRIPRGTAAPIEVLTPSLGVPSLEPALVRSPQIVVQAPKQVASAATQTSAATQNREIESRWLGEGNNALLRGNADEALTWVAKHKASYPEGALREEREVLAIQALVSSNRREEANQRATQFRLRFAKSARMASVEAALREKP